jgi:ATP-dependent protease ClpP protease subunit
LLDNNNHIHLKGEINPKSSSDFITEINKITSDKIYVYIQSPGGYVESGKEIINEINMQVENGKNIICIADRAYSMAFIIFQVCPTRYITNNSILMQHPIYVSQLSGNLKTVQNLLKMIEKDNIDLLKIQCDRINIDTKEFEVLTSNELWIMGDDNIEKNTADKVISISCSKELYNTEIQEIIFNPFIGEIKTTKVKCPIIKYGKEEINNLLNQSSSYHGLNYKYKGNLYY